MSQNPFNFKNEQTTNPYSFNSSLGFTRDVVGFAKDLVRGTGRFRADSGLGIARNTILGIPKAAKDIFFPTRGYTEEELKIAKPSPKQTVIAIPKYVAEFSSAIGELLGSSDSPTLAQKFSQTKIGGKLADVGEKITEFGKVKNVEEAKAMRFADILSTIPIGSLKTSLTAAKVIAETKDLGVIRNVLQKELKAVKSPKIIDSLAEVLVDIDNVDDVQKAINSLDNLATETKVAKQNFSKTDESFHSLLTEMEVSKAGERVMVGDEIKGIASTFPEWVNPELRNKKLFDSVLEKLQSPEDLITFKGSSKENALVENIRAELKNQTGQAFDQLKIRQMSRSKEISSLEETARSIEEPQIEMFKETKLKKAEIQNQIDLREDPFLTSDKVDEIQLSKLAEETPAAQLEEAQGKYKEATPYSKIVLDTNTPVKQKVGILDYLRTPDRVLNKIGLGEVSKVLRKSYDSYLDELPKHIEVITDWSKQVPKEANERIFQWLDGRKGVTLEGDELRIGNEIRDYLKMWADRLNLPEDSRISHYITHIFEIGKKQKEFDEDIAKLIKNKVPGSVYDPFLLERLGAKGYVEDTWRALDAYVKRAVRKANMDPALDMMKRASSRLEDSQLEYVKRLGARINMRPTEWDNLLDNTIKQLIGYRFGQRPTAVISGTLRRMVYRGALGLNINSAVKNLTQGVNTFAKLGARDTLTGYIKLLKPGVSKELVESGILRESFIQDRTLSATKQMLQKIDKGLFAMFQLAEKVNRGSAYFGAKNKALRKGLNEVEAMNFAKKMVRDTQFVFGSIDTPVAMQGDIAKMLFQFGSFSQKQIEFLGEMAKNREFAGIIRYIVASLATVYTAGKVFDIDAQDFNPVNYFARFGKPPALALPIAVIKAVLNIPDQFGNVPSTERKIKDIIYSGKTLIPAGVQLDRFRKGGIINTPKKTSKKKNTSSSNPYNF